MILMSDGDKIDAHLSTGDRVMVDFDNTLTDSDVAWWEDELEEPNDAMVEAVDELYARGKTIIVWTARPWSESGKIAGRLTEWGVPFHAIRCGKGSAHAYIDDKAIRPNEAVSALTDTGDNTSK